MSMRMSFGQEMRMAQKQVLAPRMIQSMEILQLPLLALEERIEQEIQNNETLELVEPEIDSNAPVETPTEAAQTTASEQPLVVDQDEACDVRGGVRRVVQLDPVLAGARVRGVSLVGHLVQHHRPDIAGRWSADRRDHALHA